MILIINVKKKHFFFIIEFTLKKHWKARIRRFWCFHCSKQQRFSLQCFGRFFTLKNS